MKKLLYLIMLVVLLIISFLFGNSTSKVEDLISPRYVWLKGELKYQGESNLSLSIKPPIGYFIEVPATERVYLVCSKGKRPKPDIALKIRGMLEPICGDLVCFPAVVGECFEK